MKSISTNPVCNSVQTHLHTSLQTIGPKIPFSKVISAQIEQHDSSIISSPHLHPSNDAPPPSKRRHDRASRHQNVFSLSTKTCGGSRKRIRDNSTSDLPVPSRKRYDESQKSLIDALSISSYSIHCSHWRRLYFQRAPGNILNPVENKCVPFDTALDVPLADFDRSNTIESDCGILIRLNHPLFPSQQKAVVNEDELEIRVREANCKITELMDVCHRARVSFILQRARKQVKMHLEKAQSYRIDIHNLVRDSKKEIPLRIVEKRIVTAQRACLQRQNTRENAPKYWQGREDYISNRFIEEELQPRRYLYLCELPVLPQMGASVGANELYPVQDDPIIRSAPFSMSNSNQIDNEGIQLLRKEECCSALDDERKEYCLRYLVANFQEIPSFMRWLKKWKLFSQPETDYCELQRRQQAKNATITSSRIEIATLRSRLKPYWHPHSASGQLECEESSQIARLFCRQCYSYHCLLHGVNIGIPRRRQDPEYPSMLGFMEPEQEPEVFMDTPDQSLRRSNRMSTAVCTKASSFLREISRSTEEIKPILPLKIYKCEQRDASDYGGILSSMEFVNEKIESTVCEWTLANNSHLEQNINFRRNRAICSSNTLAASKKPQKTQIQLWLAEIANRSAFRSVGYNMQFDVQRVHTQHLYGTRIQRVRDRAASHEYKPCRHTQSCDSNACSCMQRDHFCEKACQCPRDCPNRFPGCQCAFGACGSVSCPCFAANRECDPDKCFTCGVVNIAANWNRMEAATEQMCGNANILSGQSATLRVAVSKTHGYGAFAATKLSLGKFICEYNGALLSQDEAERRGNVYDSSKLSYLFDLNEDRVIDATQIGNKSKFVNHSSTRPNVEAIIMNVSGHHRIGFYAKKVIIQGEELLFDYGFRDVVPEWTQITQLMSRDEQSKGI